MMYFAKILSFHGEGLLTRGLPCKVSLDPNNTHHKVIHDQVETQESFAGLQNHA